MDVDARSLHVRDVHVENLTKHDVLVRDVVRIKVTAPFCQASTEGIANNVSQRWVC